MNSKKLRHGIFESVEPRLLLTVESALPLVSIVNQQVVSFFDSTDGPRVVSGDVTDLNNDGLMDFVVGTSNPVGVRFYLGTDEGGVQELANEKITGEVVDLVVGDINGDGWDDAVAATNFGVFTFLNRGVDDEGIWGVDSRDSRVSGVKSLLLEDLNGDGSLDLVLGTTRNVEVRFGEADGSFADPIDYHSGRGDKYVTAADLDKDGHADFVVANRETHQVVVMRNDGDGFFESTHTVDSLVEVRTITLAHLDDDDYLDLFVGAWEQEGHNLLIWAGTADATFVDDPTHHEIVGSPMNIAVGDINQDGRQDVIVGHDSTFHHPITNNGPGGVSLLMGTESGGLSPSVRVSTPGAMDVMVHVAGPDQKPEIVAFQQWQSTAVRFQWAEQTLFDGAVDYSPAVAEPFSWKVSAVGDFDGNGFSDVVVVDRWRERPQSSVHLRQADGSYLERSFSLPRNATVNEIFAGDFNGDGVSDLGAELQVNNNRQLGVMLADGEGAFSDFTRLRLRNEASFSFRQVLDINGDGSDDLVALISSNSNVSLVSAVSQADGTWDPGESISLARDGYAKELRIADLNHDDKLDAFVVTSEGIHAVYGDGLGGFERPVTQQVDTEIYSVGDINGDGFFDVATRKFDSQRLDLLFGDGQGMLEVQRVSRVPAAHQLAMFDISGDGQDELLFQDQAGFESYAWIDGQLQPMGYTNVGFAPGPMSEVDIDGDSDLDLVISQSQGFISTNPSTQIAVLLRSDEGLAAPVAITTPLIDGVIGEIDVVGLESKITILHRNGFAVVSGASELTGDFNRDGRIGINDLDLLCAIIHRGGTTPNEVDLYDLDHDDSVGESDVDVWISDIANTRRGDLDLDGTVGFLDFLILADNFDSMEASYSQGDVNCDGRVAFSDFVLLAMNFGL